MRHVARALLVAALLCVATRAAGAACVPPLPPSGLVGRWRAEGNGTDSANGTHGSVGTTTFVSGEVAHGFNFLPRSLAALLTFPCYNMV